MALMVIACFIGTVGAQDTHRYNVYGKAGYGSTSEDEGPLGNGALWGIGFAARAGRSWELGIEIDRQRNNRPGEPGTFFHQGHTTTAAGIARHFWRDAGVRPYVCLGLAYAQMTADRGFNASAFDPGFRRTGTQHFWGPDLGVGLKIPVGSRLSLQPEARLFWGGSGNYDPFDDIVEPPLILGSFAAVLSYRW